MERKETQYTCRHVARITVEAQTPLAVGSGMATIMTDSPVITDINGMPYIPATALAGVVRHAVCLPDDSKDKIFGYQTNNGGRGSQIIFTDAVMIGKDGKALDGICHIDWTDNFYHHYQQLPIRDHVRIDDKGANADTGKFDNEVAYKGTRFVFEIELVSVDDKTDMFDKTIARLYDETFRIGGGTRSGYGKLRVVECKVASLNLCNPVELKQYVAKSSNLSEPWGAFKLVKHSATLDQKQWTKYELRLKPLDFFLFGSGKGDEDADNVFVTEPVVEWRDNKPFFVENNVLIPASSIKGALAHRTAYNYNKLRRYYAEEHQLKDENENPAVKVLFGTEGNNGKDNSGIRGNVIVNDLLEAKLKDKVFSHIKNDYFTGGTIEGALFQEKSAYGAGVEYVEEILVQTSAIQNDEVCKAFEQSLKDLCNGYLPLGGSTGRGNGFFYGKVLKNDIEL